MMRCTGALAVSNAPCVSPASNRRSVATRASGGDLFRLSLATRGARVARRHACVSRTRVDGRVRHTTRRDALTDGTRGVSSTTPSPDPNDGDENDVVFGLPRKAVAEPFGILLGSQFVLFVGVGALLPALPLYAQSIGLSGSANGVVLSAPALAMLLLNLPAGKLVDSWGRKQMMMAWMFVIALSDFATGQCRTVAHGVGARLALAPGAPPPRAATARTWRTSPSGARRRAAPSPGRSRRCRRWAWSSARSSAGASPRRTAPRRFFTSSPPPRWRARRGTRCSPRLTARQRRRRRYCACPWTCPRRRRRRSTRNSPSRRNKATGGRS